MDAVKEFNSELCSLYEIQPPVTKAKMSQITKTAIKALKFYKHVVQSVEKFIQKCRQEYKVPGLYIIDSIIRCSRKQFGPDKDMFAPRFSKNIVITFHNLFDCPSEDISKMIRVLNLWQKNGVYHPGIIQPLLDLASDPHNPAVFETVQKQVEQVTGLTPSMPLKCDQKPPALTADALQLGTGLDLKSDLQGDFSKVINQLMQSMIPNPVPSLGLNPQVQLQLLQQLLQLPVPVVPSAPLLPSNVRLPSSSTVDNSLIGQIQMLTQQLLNQTASVPNAQMGINAMPFDGQQKQIEPPLPDSEHFEAIIEPGGMSSLDKRIMFMCQGGDGRDEAEDSHHRWHGDHDGSKKQGQSKKMMQNETNDRTMSEVGCASDAVNPVATPNSPENASSQKSSPRRSSSCNNNDDDDPGGYRRTPPSGENEEDFQNGSGVEDDSDRSSDKDSRAEHRSQHSRNCRKNDGSESKSRKSKRHAEDCEDLVDHRSRKSRHKSRSNERSSTYKRSPSPALDRSDRSRHKKRPREKHDSRSVERRKSKDDLKRLDVSGRDDVVKRRHGKKAFESPERKRKRPEFTVEYGMDEDDDDDDVIFVDMQKKSIDVSRFLEKKLPSLKPKRKRESRSHSRSSSVEFIAQDVNVGRHCKDREFMPPIKSNTLSVCSTTLWIGHLNKLTSEDELKAELTEFGETTIILVPPRGCAFINFASRAEAYRALDHLKNVSLQGSQLKVAWAAGVGIKNSPFYERHDSDLGVTYIPWNQMSSLDLPPLLEGSFVDEDSLPPNFNSEILTVKKPKKRKVQQKPENEMPTEMTVINPSLIPLPQAAPLPPPPVPPISNAISVSAQLQNVGASLVQPLVVPSMNVPPPLPPSPCPISGTIVSSSPSSTSQMGPLKGMLHFDPSIPPPCFPPPLPMQSNDNMPMNALPSRFMPPSSIPMPEMMFKNIEMSSVASAPTSSSEPQINRSGIEGLSNVPMLINNQAEATTNQSSVPNQRNIFNAIIRGPINILNNSLNQNQSPLPMSVSGILHHPSLNRVVMAEKQEIKLLPQNANFVVQRPMENQLTMPGCVLRPIGHPTNNMEPHLVKVAQLVASGMNQEPGNNSLVIGQGQVRPGEMGAQQNVVLQSSMNVVSLAQLRPNLLQPPPSAQLSAPLNHQETVNRLPVPSEFLRRLGASTTSAPAQGNMPGNNSNKQVPLLPMPQVTVPPPGLQVPPMSPAAGSLAQDDVVPSPTSQNNDSHSSTSVKDSKPQRKQPLLDTPLDPKDVHFAPQIHHHPSQMLSLNHPMYNNLDVNKKDSNDTAGGVLPLQTPNMICDRFRTPRPPKFGVQEISEKQSNLPIIFNFQNSPCSNPSEALISEAIKTLSPLVRIPTAQECMGLLRNPLMNPARFLAAPHIPRMDMRMHLRSPGMRGPINFKAGDRRNLVRPLGVNHQRPARHWQPHNQQ